MILPEVSGRIDRLIFDYLDFWKELAQQDVNLKSLLELKKEFAKPNFPVRLTFRPNRFLGSRKQVRFPKSKKNRIRRKWAKRPDNYAFVPDQRYYLFADGEIVAHPTMLQRLYKALGIPSGSTTVEVTPFQTDALTSLITAHENPARPD